MTEVANNKVTTKKIGGRSGKGFMPGQSGNPTGRPKMPEEVKAMFKAAAPDAVQNLIATMNDEKTAPALKIECIKIVLDRALGKPLQAVDLDSNSIIEIKLSNELTTYGS